MDEAIKTAFVQQLARITAAGERLAQMNDASFLLEVQAVVDTLARGPTPQPPRAAVQAPRLAPTQGPMRVVLPASSRPQAQVGTRSFTFVACGPPPPSSQSGPSSPRRPPKALPPPAPL